MSDGAAVDVGAVVCDDGPHRPAHGRGRMAESSLSKPTRAIITLFLFFTLFVVVVEYDPPRSVSLGVQPRLGQCATKVGGHILRQYAILVDPLITF